MATNKLYLCYYDELYGAREECNVFYSGVVRAETMDEAIVKFIRHQRRRDPNYKVTDKDIEEVVADEVTIIE
jgi:hypothetical protein